MSRRSRIHTAAACLLSVLLPAAGRAQTDPQRTVAAQALYDQALQQLDAKHYAGACPMLEEVTRLMPDGLGAKLTLGDCYEGQGKLASALAQYALVEAMAPKMGQPDRAQKAAQKTAELKPRLAMLTIEVSREARSIAGLTISRNGVQVGHAQWGIPLPVDTGLHQIAAQAPGRKSWAKLIEIKSDGEKVAIMLDPLEPLPNRAATPAPPPPCPPPVPHGRPIRTWQQPLGIAAMTLGAAGTGAGFVFGFIAISQKNWSTQGFCDAQDRCNPTGYELRREAAIFGNWSTGAFVAGGVLLAGGLTLVITGPLNTERTRTAPRPHMRANIDVLPGGLQLKGRW